MRLISKEVNKLIHKVFKSHHPVLGEIIISWSKIVGIKFNDSTIPLKIVSTRSGGKKINILYVSAENSSISMELSYQQELMIERIAVYLGYKAIHKIKILVRG